MKSCSASDIRHCKASTGEIRLLFHEDPTSDTSVIAKMKRSMQNLEVLEITLGHQGDVELCCDLLPGSANFGNESRIQGNYR